MANDSVLNRILTEAWQHSQAGSSFLAVFDLDSTLYDLTLRVAAIVDDFCAEPAHQALYPEECKKLGALEIRQTDWGLETPLRRAGLKVDGLFFRDLERYWSDCFFSGDYLLHDEPLPGAVSFVQELHQIGAHIMYLTGRDIPRMAIGTEHGLRTHGFPMDRPGIEVVLKPEQTLDDARFKTDVLKLAEKKYERIWLFENEPVNLNLIAKECPTIGLVFIDSTHSGREKLAPLANQIIHFECDLDDLRRTRS